MKKKTLLEDKNTIFINVTKTKHIEEDHDDEGEIIDSDQFRVKKSLLIKNRLIEKA